MAGETGRLSESADREETHAIPLRAGVVYGVLAALATYVAVVLFLGVHVVAMAHTTLGGVGPHAFFFGTLGDFFGSHVGVTDGVVLGVAGVGAVPALVYYLVPPLLLVVCGRRCVTVTTTDGDREVFLRGASVALGYGTVVVLALAVLFGAVEFGIVGLDPVRAVLLAGIVYPVVFGGLGGYTTRLW